MISKSSAILFSQGVASLQGSAELYSYVFTIQDTNSAKTYFLDYQSLINFRDLFDNMLSQIIEPQITTDLSSSKPS